MCQTKRQIVIILTVGVLLFGLFGTAAAQDREAQLAEAKKLNDQAVKLHDAGRYDEAVPMAERALAIQESVLGQDHPDVAATVNNLAELYLAKNDYTRAEPLLLRALAIREKMFGTDHSDVASSLSSLAELYYAMGDYKRAAPLFLRALAIDEKAQGAEHPSVASDLNNLGVLYKVQGDYERAEPLLLRALAIDEKVLGKESPNIAGDLNNLATLYQAKGDYVRAEPLFAQVLTILEKAYGPKHPLVAATLNNLAEFCRMKGDYLCAEPLYLRTLTILKEISGAEHPNVLTVMNNLALLYSAKGDSSRAEALHRQALAIREKALAVDHPDIAQSLNNLATAYEEMGDPARAEPLYMRSLAIREKVFSEEHPLVAESLHNLGEMYRAMGDLSRAEPLYARSLAILEKVLGVDHPSVATVINNLALLYIARGDYSRAETLYAHSLSILEKAYGPKHPLVAQALNNLAALCEANGDYQRAVQYLRRSQEIREHNLELILTTGSEKQKQLYLNTLSAETDGIVSLHVHSVPSNVEASQLALTAILLRKGRALDAVTDQIATLRRHATSQDQAMFDQLAAARSYLATLQLFGGGQMAPKVRQEQITKLEAEVEHLEGEISRRSGEFRAQSQIITLDAVRKAIPADAALVEIFKYQPFNPKAQNRAERFSTARYVAYVLHRNAMTPQWVELGEASTIDEEVGRLRAALRDPKRWDIQSLARTLDERVMRPIRKLLGQLHHILLSPDGALNLIPFATLVDENGKYLIEDYSFTYLTSGRDLLRLQAQTVSNSVPVIIANPLYDLRATSRPRKSGGIANKRASKEDENRRSIDFTQKKYIPLLGTEEEAAGLVKLLPQRTQVLLQAKATEAALKQLHRPLILHIATHGFFLPDQLQVSPSDKTLHRGTFDVLEMSPLPAKWENPLLRSGLVLTGVKQGQSGAGEDGVLTALEAAGLDLRGTKLVVLSACETGLGEVRNGAGVYGLRRALVLAGSETQVMSLWKVSDSGTRDLMTTYYKRLKTGEGRTESLRQVQLAMLRGQLSPSMNSGKRETRDTNEKIVIKDYRHPYYWAAFIQSGNWRSLDGK